MRCKHIGILFTALSFAQLQAADVRCTAGAASEPQMTPSPRTVAVSSLILVQQPGLGGPSFAFKTPGQTGSVHPTSGDGFGVGGVGGLPNTDAPSFPGGNKLNVQGLVDKSFYDPQINLQIGSLVRKLRPERQLDPEVAVPQTKVHPDRLSQAERARLGASSSCSTSYKDLSRLFELNRKALGIPAAFDLGSFIAWYYQPDLPPALRAKAQPVIDAQRKFDKACLESSIPREMGPSLMQRAVGVLMFENKVFCTAMRVSPTEIMTAQHCFVDPITGLRTADAETSVKGQGRLWFAYEGEADTRYEVCHSSLPTPRVGSNYAPAADVARVRTAATRTAVPEIVFAKTPIETGMSLYIRGYFPFADSSEGVLARMRSTKAGGCFAHSAAGQCFFHACQTTQIMSGAPIFVRPEPEQSSERLVVAGMHLGSALLSDPKGSTGAVCIGADGTKVPLSNFAYQFK